MTFDGKQGEIAWNIMREHIGHDIVVALYGSLNTAIECQTCWAVLFDADSPEQKEVENA